MKSLHHTKKKFPLTEKNYFSWRNLLVLILFYLFKNWTSSQMELKSKWNFSVFHYCAFGEITSSSPILNECNTQSKSNVLFIYFLCVWRALLLSAREGDFFVYKKKVCERRVERLFVQKWLTFIMPKLTFLNEIKFTCYIMQTRKRWKWNMLRIFRA
jgi:hypothetical protein